MTSEQYILGITGEIGAGKSYVSKRFEELGKDKGVIVHSIDVDRIGHRILGEKNERFHEQIRAQITQTFGSEVKNSDGTINRKELGGLVFNDSENRHKLNQIMRKPMMLELEKELRDKKGLIIIDAALLVEANWTYLCNNNVVLVKTDKPSQERRLKERGLNEEQIKRRLESQYSLEEKQRKLKETIEKNSCGRIFYLNNSDASNNIEAVFEEVEKYFNFFALSNVK